MAPPATWALLLGAVQKGSGAKMHAGVKGIENVAVQKGPRAQCIAWDQECGSTLRPPDSQNKKCMDADHMGGTMGVMEQGIKNIAVQSSVSLQHLPYDTAMEKNLPQSLVARLSFATQKLAEIVNAAQKPPPPSPRGPSLLPLPSVGALSLSVLALIFREHQVDEPALREGLPLKKERWASYLDWAVDAFKLATVVAAPSTQIVTHLCYSEFADILPAIDGLDADVLTIENSRSGNEMIEALAKYGYSRDIGPGVYDVHSPVVPTVEFMYDKIRSFMSSGILKGHPDRIWVNPDCGLKTREWAQVLPSLQNMVTAAAKARATLA
eukprot:jgi/Botrbrau1/3341/Bobra.0048s0036.1